MILTWSKGSETCEDQSASCSLLAVNLSTVILTPRVSMTPKHPACLQKTMLAFLYSWVSCFVQPKPRLVCLALLRQPAKCMYWSMQAKCPTSCCRTANKVNDLLSVHIHRICIQIHIMHTLGTLNTLSLAALHSLRDAPPRHMAALYLISICRDCRDCRYHKC